MNRSPPYSENFHVESVYACLAVYCSDAVSGNLGFTLIKTHDSESRGQEEAAVRDE